MTPSLPLFQMFNLDSGIYYIVLFGGDGTEVYVVVKPYAWP
ncbi:MAG: hypothetical protein ACFFF4_04255 [Candidatus Thorarchaeota archaeon]